MPRVSKNTKISAPKTKKTAVKRTSSRKSKQVTSTGYSPKFLAATVLATALLVALIVGFASHKAVPSYAVQPVSDGSASMYLSPPMRNDITPGSTVRVTLHEDSGNVPVNAVQSAIQYPQDKLELVSVTPSKNFAQQAALDTMTPGLIRLARAVSLSGVPNQGRQLIAVINFRVKPGATGEAIIAFDSNASMVVGSDDNRNILQNAPAVAYYIKN